MMHPDVLVEIDTSPSYERARLVGRIIAVLTTLSSCVEDEAVDEFLQRHGFSQQEVDDNGAVAIAIMKQLVDAGVLILQPRSLQS